MKKILIILITLILFVISGCSSTQVNNIKKDAVDQLENIVDKDNKYVLMVKNGHPVDYPNATYGDSFEKFFSSPTWKYFESDDGKDVVEFTGNCMYQETEVKARMQFILDADAGTFEAGALSFNDVPQNQLITGELLSKVFEDSSQKANDSAKTPETSSTNKNEGSDASNNSDATSTNNKSNEIDLFTYIGKGKADIMKSLGNPVSISGTEVGDLYNYDDFYIAFNEDIAATIVVNKPGFNINGIQVGMLPEDIKSKNGKPTKEGNDNSGFFMEYRLNNDSFSIICASDDSNSPIKSISASDLTFSN